MALREESSDFQKDATLLISSRNSIQRTEIGIGKSSEERVDENNGDPHLADNDYEEDKDLVIRAERGVKSYQATDSNSGIFEEERRSVNEKRKNVQERSDEKDEEDIEKIGDINF